MSNLFDNVQLQKKLNEYKVEIKDNSAIFLKWHNDKQKEEALQTNFLNDIFGKVLGYEIDTGEAEFNLLTEYKTQKDGTKVDGVLGFITNGKKDIRVAIELKSKTTKSLDEVEKQAFEYRDKIDGIEWVITSNTSEIRLYSAGSGGRLKHQSWTFFELANSIEKQKEFHFLLSKDRLFTKTSNQSPVHALDTTEKGEEIEKRFYKHYSTLREEIWHNLLDLNKEKHYGRNFYLYKAQKLIDRIIFIRFCKENGALDNDAVLEALNNKYIKGKYNRMKALFTAMDEGNPEIGIAKFNGGLFASDTDLDCLNISDEIIDKIVILYAHDFGSDLDVNILGHIFEQSISDLESLTGDNEKKRKKDGVFYTPAYITEYIVREVVGGWLDDRKAEIKAKEGSKDWWKEYAENLKSIKVLDPACGSGAFLVKVFDYLQNEWREVQKHIKTEPTVGGSHWTYKDILTHNIYGVDINPASTGITKLSLWLKTAHYREPLTTLDGNIKIGNSLIDNPDIAGYYSEFEGKVIQEVIAKDLFNASDLEKLTAEGVKKSLAFKWSEEFKEVFDAGGFDVVVGNPPYVNVRNIDKKAKEYLTSKYKVAKEQYDLYTLFIERGRHLLVRYGYLSFIIPDKFMIADYGKPLINMLYQETEIKAFQDYTSQQVFEGASVYPVVIVVKNHTVEKQTISLAKTSSFLTKIESVNKVTDFKVWRPLASSGNIETGSNVIVSNSEISRYGIDTHRKGVIKTARTSDIQKNKILLKKLCYNFEASFDNEGYHPINTTYCITTENTNILYLLSLLNSKLFSNYAREKYKQTALRGGYIELRVNQVQDLPFIQIPTEAQTPFITHAQKMLDLTRELNEQNTTMFELLAGDFPKIKINNKLKKWSELSWGEFLSAITSQKISMTDEQEEKWLKRFKRLSVEAIALRENITRTDAEIDKMVYALYGLSEGEIGVVEGLVA